MSSSEEEGYNMSAYMSEEDQSDEEDFDAFHQYEDDQEDNVGMVEENNKNGKSTIKRFIAKIVDSKEIKRMIIEKIIDVAGRFEFVKLEEGIILEFLRNNNFLVDQAAGKLEQSIFEHIETRAIKTRDNTQELFCGIDGMELEPHEAFDLGCGHTFCSDCFNDYITQKVSEGPLSIFAQCPQEGCKFTISMNIVDIMTSKEIQEMYLLGVT